MPTGADFLVPASVPPWEAGVASFAALLVLGAAAALLIRHRERATRHPHSSRRLGGRAR